MAGPANEGGCPGSTMGAIALEAPASASFIRRAKPVVGAWPPAAGDPTLGPFAPAVAGSIRAWERSCIE
jgi:hypothetical protein